MIRTSHLLTGVALLATTIQAAPAMRATCPGESSKRAATPAQLVGSWGFTTISGTTYWDKSTGAYMGSGMGGAQSYTFLPGGRYKFFNYVKAGSYGWEMQTLTWEEGIVSESGDSITLRPSSGKYQVMDNRVKKNNYTRPMRPSERKTKTFRWKIEARNGKPTLLLGGTAFTKK